MTKNEQFWTLIGKLKGINPKANVSVKRSDDKNGQPYLIFKAPISEKTYKENFEDHNK